MAFSTDRMAEQARIARPIITRLVACSLGFAVAAASKHIAMSKSRCGDFVLGPKNRWHHLEPVGTEPSIRTAINARGEFHRYDRPGCKPLPTK